MNNYVEGFQGGRSISGQNPMDKIDGFNRRFDTRKEISDIPNKRPIEEPAEDAGLDEGIWDLNPLEDNNIVNETFPLPMSKTSLPPKIPLEQDISSRSIPKANEVENKKEKRGIELPVKVARALAILTVGTSLILSACKPKNTQVSTSEPTSEIPISEPIDPDLLSSTPTATKEPTPIPTSTPTKEPTPTPTARPVPYAFSLDVQNDHRVEDENLAMATIYLANLNLEGKASFVQHIGGSSLRNYTREDVEKMIQYDLDKAATELGMDTTITPGELEYLTTVMLHFAEYKEFYYYRGTDDFMCVFPLGLTGVYFVKPDGSVEIIETLEELSEMNLPEETIDAVYNNYFIFLEEDGKYIPACEHLETVYHYSGNQ